MLEGLPDPPQSSSDLRSLLTEDVLAHWVRLKSEDNPVNRRAYVRAVFALIEGFLAVLKYHTLAELKAGRITLSPGELQLLLEASYTANDEGKPHRRDTYVPTAQNIRFTFAVFAKTHLEARLPDYSGAGWKAMKEAVTVRNRLTHPRKGADLEVSHDELSAVETAVTWYLDASFATLVEGKAALLVKLNLAGIGTVST